MWGWFFLADAVDGVWGGDIVVLFLPLSFYAKKKAAERKTRIRGGGAEDARIREHMAAPVPPLMYLHLTAQPIAQRRVIVRNARRAFRLAFLIWRMHVQRFSFSRSQSVYTRCLSWDMQRDFRVLFSF